MEGVQSEGTKPYYVQNGQNQKLPPPPMQTNSRTQIPQIPIQNSQQQPSQVAQVGQVGQPQYLYPNQMLMRPYMPYPPMPQISQISQMSYMDQELRNAKCCLTMCNTECGLPWLYGCGMFIGGCGIFSLLINLITVGMITTWDFEDQFGDEYHGIEWDFLPTLNTIGSILIYISMLTCGIVGCFGKTNRNPTLIFVAIIANIILIIGQLIMIAIFIGIKTKIDDYLNENNKHSYSSSEDSIHETTSTIFNFIMIVACVFCSVWILLYIIWIYDQYQYYSILKRIKNPRNAQPLAMQPRV